MRIASTRVLPIVVAWMLLGLLLRMLLLLGCVLLASLSLVWLWDAKCLFS